MSAAIVWPSWLLGVEGDAAGLTSNGIRHINQWMYDHLGHYVSDNPKSAGYQSVLLILAAAFIGFALYTAHRYFTEKRAARATSTTTTATPTASSTRVTAGRKKR